MPWLKWNPNPMGKTTGDCTIRAVCAATGLPWHAVHDAMCALSGELCDMPSTNSVWWTFLHGIGFRQILVPNTCPDCYTVAEFAADHPRGRYILGPYQHAVAVIDGDWWDTWDSGDTVPIYYFEGGNDNGMESSKLLPGRLRGGTDAAADADAHVSAADGAAGAADAAADDDTADHPRGDRAGGR